jgi:hypothetical protein
MEMEYANPWDLKSLNDLQRCYYVCPECHDMIQDSERFLRHVQEHPLASDFIKRNIENHKNIESQETKMIRHQQFVSVEIKEEPMSSFDNLDPPVDSNEEMVNDHSSLGEPSVSISGDSSTTVKSYKRKRKDTNIEDNDPNNKTYTTYTTINLQEPNMKMRKVSVHRISSMPWEILTQFIRQNAPYTSKQLLCFEEWMKGPNMYTKDITDRVKTKMSQTFGQGTGTSFSKEFSELCQHHPQLWPIEGRVNASYWIGYKAVYSSKKLSYHQQIQELADLQKFGWLLLKGFLNGQEGPYKSDDLIQFEKWLKEVKMYDDIIILEIKNEMIKQYACGMNRTFAEDFPEFSPIHIWYQEAIGL